VHRQLCVRLRYQRIQLTPLAIQQCVSPAVGNRDVHFDPSVLEVQIEEHLGNRRRPVEGEHLPEATPETRL
jgi:hypothetical protein